MSKKKEVYQPYRENCVMLLKMVAAEHKEFFNTKKDRDDWWERRKAPRWREAF